MTLVSVGKDIILALELFTGLPRISSNTSWEDEVDLVVCFLFLSWLEAIVFPASPSKSSWYVNLALSNV